MKRLPQIAIVAMALAGLLAGCKQDDAIDGFDLLSNPADRGSVDSTTIWTAFEQTFEDSVRKTGSGSFLELGAFDGLETQILLRFDSVPDTVQVLAAKLLLNTNTIYATGDAKSSFRATVHKVNIPWTEGSVAYDEFHTGGNSFDASAISSAEIFSSAADLSTSDSLFIETLKLDLSPAGLELVRNWADSTRSDNHGILIDFEGSNFIKEFLSQNGSINQPRLELDVMRGTVRDTILSVADADAFLVNRVVEPAGGPLFVDNVFGHQTALRFDLSDIPRESTINNAVLKLNILSSQSNVKNSGFTVWVTTLADSFTTENVRVDSSGFTTTATVGKQTTVLEIPLLALLQVWVTESVQNHGILLRTISPGSDITRVAMQSNATDPLLAPRVEVEFSSAPNSN